MTNIAFLLGTIEHPAKGSPVNPGKHLHIGACLTTTQDVCVPHDPGQGSLHRSDWQAKELGHSAFIVHSGLQFGGRPI